MPCALTKIQLPWIFLWLCSPSLSIDTSPSSQLLLEVSVFPLITGIFPETLQMFVASHLQISLFTFCEKCWCLDVSLCLDFYIIPDLFFQNHHLGEQTWLMIMVYLLFLHHLIVKMFLLSSVKLVKLLSSNLDLINYLLVLHLFPTFLSTFLIISKLLPNTAASSSTTSDLPKCLPFPTFSSIMYYLNALLKCYLMDFCLFQASWLWWSKWSCRCVVTCLFNTSDNVAL